MKSFHRIKTTKLVAIGVAVSLLSGAVGYAAGEWQNIWVQFNSVNLNVNGQTVSSPNLLYNDRTYVPLRTCAEMLGSSVNWDQYSNTANIVANRPSSADTSKAINDLKTAEAILNRLDTISQLAHDLELSYVDCITYANLVRDHILNPNESSNSEVNQKLNNNLKFFNSTIELYRDYFIYIDEINANAKIINCSNLKIESMFEYYSKSIDNLKDAYHNLDLLISEIDVQYLRAQRTQTAQAIENISAGYNIRNEAYVMISNYIQSY